MKIRKLFKRAAAFALAAVTALSVIPATTAFAAGDIGTISFTHTYDGAGNAMRYNSSANINGHTAGGTGEYKYRMYVDGETAFCLQPGVPLKTGNTLAKASSNTWNALSADQKKAVGLALLYGYQGNSSNLSGSDDEKWLATQTLVGVCYGMPQRHKPVQPDKHDRLQPAFWLKLCQQRGEGGLRPDCFLDDEAQHDSELHVGGQERHHKRAFL